MCHLVISKGNIITNNCHVGEDIDVELILRYQVFPYLLVLIIS